MAASCVVISLSSTNVIPKYKALPFSSFEALNAQFPCSISFHLSVPSPPSVSKNPHTQVSSSTNFLVSNDDSVDGGGETGIDNAVSDAESAMKKKVRPCEVYVCNLPKSFDMPQLFEMFQPYGTIISVEVSRNPETGESRGSGYVTMASVYSAKIAIASLDGTEVGGRELRVRYSVEMNPGSKRNPAVLNSTPKKIMIYESKYKIYLGNLPWAAKPDELRSHFSSFGTVVSLRILHDRKGAKKRVFGFISYLNRQERDAAISLNGTEFQGRKIIVREGFEMERGDEL